MFKLLRNVFILPVILSLSACVSTEVVHGHVIKENQLSEIRTGIHDKNDVAAIMGTPSSVSTFKDDKWYYISETRIKKPLKTSSLKDRRIIIVEFDEKGRVALVSEKDASSGKIIVRNENITPTAGQNLGVVEQVFGNLGAGL